MENGAKVKPDLLAFTGDQFYESSGGFGVIRTPVDGAMIGYLRQTARNRAVRTIRKAFAFILRGTSIYPVWCSMA